MVSLLECLGKVVEKAMTTAITEWVERLLHNGQMGGRKGRSAVDAVAALTGRAQMALEEGEAYGVVLADVKGAFDQHDLLETIAQLI